jgi:hypothetical protein
MLRKNYCVRFAIATVSLVNLTSFLPALRGVYEKAYIMDSLESTGKIITL